MTNLLEVSSGRIVLRDTDGSTRFDSDEKLFQATTRATGSVSLGPWEATATNGFKGDINSDTSYLLQSVNSACDTVVGSFQLTSTGSPAYGVGGLGWFNASGSYVHYVASSGTIGDFGFVTFTFLCSGGGLYLNERVVLGAAQPSTGGITNRHIVLGLSFEYNLF